MKYGIFTKQIHIEKLVNFLNTKNIDYFVSTSRDEINLDFDIGVSYCFPYIVDVNYPMNSKRIWYNYHPAPLPEYPGRGSYVDAINDKVKEFGVTLHVMTNQVDKGDILKRRKFKLDSLPVNSNELGSITHYHLFQLFKETIEFLKNKPESAEELSLLDRRIVTK